MRRSRFDLFFVALVVVVLVIAASAILSFDSLSSLFTGKAIDSGYSCGSYSLMTPSSSVASSNFSFATAANRSHDSMNSTSWVSKGVIGPHWIYYDLGTIRCISAIDIFLSVQYTPINMNIQVSDDGVTWVNVVTNWNVTTSGQYIRKNFSAVDGRYVRLYQTKGKSITGSGSGEVASQSTTFYGSVNEVRFLAAQRVVASGSGAVVTSGSFCTDSDGGKDYSLRGVINATNVLVSDSCLSSTTLMEYYCSGSSYSQQNYVCSGGCSAGRCLNIVEAGNPAAPQPDNGGSGGSDASGFVIIPYKDLLDGKTLNFVQGETYALSFGPYFYFIRVRDVSPSEVILFLEDEFREITVSQGQSTRLDLDGDGVVDLELLFQGSTSSDTVGLFIPRILGDAVNNPASSDLASSSGAADNTFYDGSSGSFDSGSAGADAEVTDSASEESSNRIFWIIGLIVLVFVIAFVGFSVFFR